MLPILSLSAVSFRQDPRSAIQGKTIMAQAQLSSATNITAFSIMTRNKDSQNSHSDVYNNSNNNGNNNNDTNDDDADDYDNYIIYCNSNNDNTIITIMIMII